MNPYGQPDRKVPVPVPSLMKMVSRRVHCHLISIISSLCTVEVIIHQGNWSLEYWKVIRALLGDGAH